MGPQGRGDDPGNTTEKGATKGKDTGTGEWDRQRAPPARIQPGEEEGEPPEHQNALSACRQQGGEGGDPLSRSARLTCAARGRRRKPRSGGGHSPHAAMRKGRGGHSIRRNTRYLCTAFRRERGGYPPKRRGGKKRKEGKTPSRGLPSQADAGGRGPTWKYGQDGEVETAHRPQQGGGGYQRIRREI